MVRFPSTRVNGVWTRTGVYGVHRTAERPGGMTVVAIPEPRSVTTAPLVDGPRMRWLEAQTPSGSGSAITSLTWSFGCAAGARPRTAVAESRALQLSGEEIRKVRVRRGPPSPLSGGGPTGAEGLPVVTEALDARTSRFVGRSAAFGGGSALVEAFPVGPEEGAAED